jgi:hypothetical protein
MSTGFWNWLTYRRRWGVGEETLFCVEDVNGAPGRFPSFPPLSISSLEGLAEPPLPEYTSTLVPGAMCRTRGSKKIFIEQLIFFSNVHLGAWVDWIDLLFFEHSWAGDPLHPIWIKSGGSLSTLFDFKCFWPRPPRSICSKARGQRSQATAVWFLIVHLRLTWIFASPWLLGWKKQTPVTVEKREERKECMQSAESSFPRATIDRVSCFLVPFSWIIGLKKKKMQRWRNGSHKSWSWSCQKIWMTEANLHFFAPVETK